MSTVITLQPDGTNGIDCQPGDPILCCADGRVSRKADDVTNDTLAVDAYLIGVLLYYPVS